MKPRIHVITLAVADLDRALAFYRDRKQARAIPEPSDRGTRDAAGSR